jgi:hypothetical protein
MKYGGTTRRAIQTCYHPHNHRLTSAELFSATEVGVGTVVRLPRWRSRMSGESWMEHRPSSRASSSRRGWRRSRRLSDRCARGVSSSCGRLGSTPFQGIASPLRARTLQCAHLGRKGRRWIPVSEGYDSASTPAPTSSTSPHFPFFIKLFRTIGSHSRIVIPL